MKVDDYGRVLLDADEIFDAIYRDEDVSSFLGFGQDIDQYNKLCKFNDKMEHIIKLAPQLSHTSEEEHDRRLSTWFIPEAYQTMDVWAVLAERCKTPDETVRLTQEKVEYESRGLNPVLRLMLYLVDQFRENNVVWGVGRGSSVASFALYLIGITKINPMKYGLDINEFLKD